MDKKPKVFNFKTQQYEDLTAWGPQYIHQDQTLQNMYLAWTEMGIDPANAVRLCLESWIGIKHSEETTP